MNTNSNEALRAALEPFAAGPCTCGEVYRAAGVAVCVTCKARAALDTPSPVAGGDLREAVSELIEMLSAATVEEGCSVFDHTPEEIGLYVMENHTEILAALNQPAAPVEVDLLDRAELAWQRFFYPAADCFTGPIGDKLPSVDLEVADCLRLVLAAIGRHVATPDHDVPAHVEPVEPVAWMYEKSFERFVAIHKDYGKHPWRDEDREHHKSKGFTETPLYAHPPEPAASTVAPPLDITDAAINAVHEAMSKAGAFDGVGMRREDMFVGQSVRVIRGEYAGRIGVVKQIADRDYPVIQIGAGIWASKSPADLEDASTVAQGDAK